MTTGKLRPIYDALVYGRQLEAAGFDPRSAEHKAMINEFLGEPVDGSFCACGAQLKRVDMGNMKCRKCCDLQDQQREGNDGVAERMEKIGVPPAYRHCTFSSFRGDVPLAVDTFAGGKVSKPLLLFGRSTGVGKTHLGTAALYSLYLNGERCFWLSSVRLAGALESEAFDPARPTFTKSTRVRYLLVDDLGKEVGVTPKAKSLVMSVLDVRLEYNLPTIVTTNLDDEGLCAYDARLASRILAGHVAKLDGEDKRWAGELEQIELEQPEGRE